MNNQTEFPAPIMKIAPENIKPNISEANFSIVYCIHVLSDILAIFASYSLVFRLRFGFWIGSFSHSDVYAHTYATHGFSYCMLCAVCIWLVFSFTGMYEEHKKIRHTPVLWNSIIANTMGLIFTAGLLYFNRNFWHMRSFFSLFFILDSITIAVFRHISNTLIYIYRKTTGKFNNYCVLVGNGPAAAEIDKLTEKKQHRLLYKIVARFPMPENDGDWENLQAALDPSKHATLLAAQENLSRDDEMRFVKICVNTGLALKLMSRSFVTIHNPFSMGDYLNGIPFVNFCSCYRGAQFDRPYRLFSRIIGGAALLILSPVMLVVAVAVKLSSKGPPIFKQTRCGFNGKPFTMYKFRTMCEGAERLADELRVKNESNGALFKMKHDPRVTRVGAFLRKTSLDELPQFLNVLRGDMRTVGPRPLPVCDLKYFSKDWHSMRHMVPPGITCVWQVAGRSKIGFEEMCILDIWYMLNRSWTLDLKILFCTVWTVLFSDGAY